MIGVRRISMNRYTVVCCIALCYFFILGFDVLHSTGYVGATQKNGFGCICHGFGVPTESVQVWISGPDSVRIGSTNIFYMLMKGGPAVSGGFNVASGRGILSPGDSTSYLAQGELTHSFPKFFLSDTVRWKFMYLAPLSKGLDTIFSVGNSVDGDGNPSIGDEYNFGPNFVVKLVDTVVSVPESPRPLTFHLYQNYPNPFNPTTIIKYQIPSAKRVSLKVFDVLGREVATLVDRMMDAGEHSVQLDASGLSSGVYYYQMVTGTFTQTRKLVILR